MTLEHLADLIGSSSANLNRRTEELPVESYGKLLDLEIDVADLRGDVTEVRPDLSNVRRSLDLAETVSLLRRQIEEVQTDAAALKRRA